MRGGSALFGKREGGGGGGGGGGSCLKEGACVCVQVINVFWFSLEMFLQGNCGQPLNAPHIRFTMSSVDLKYNHPLFSKGDTLTHTICKNSALCSIVSILVVPHAIPNGTYAISATPIIPCILKWLFFWGVSEFIACKKNLDLRRVQEFSLANS